MHADVADATASYGHTLQQRALSADAAV